MPARSCVCARPSTAAGEAYRPAHEKIAQDTERDNFMTAEMAQAYGLVDKVLASRRDLLAEKSE